MSAISQILDQVETRVKELLGDLLGHNKEQDAKLADLELRVAALEGAAPKKAAAARPTAASASGKASSPK